MAKCGGSGLGDSTVSLQATLTLLYAIIFPVALLGNSLVLYVVFKRQSMRNVLNLLIVNMAVADLLVTIFVMPWSVSYLFVILQWFGGIFGKILCKTIHFSFTTSLAASVITLMVITVDRFLTIVFVWKTCLNLRTSKVSLVIIWIMSIVIMGHYLEVFKVNQPLKDVGNDNYYCHPDWQRMPAHFDKFFNVTVFVALYAFPLILMAILYSMIIHKLWRERIASGGDTNINSSKKRVVKMLITVTLAFAVCWLPLHIMHYYIYFEPETFTCMSSYLVLMSFWLGHANSAINPVLYVIFNKTFRRAFLQALHIESFNSIHLRTSIVRVTSDRRSSSPFTPTKTSFKNGNNNEESHPYTPPISNSRSHKEIYAYGKLIQRNEHSKSSNSCSDDGKTNRRSIMVVMDKMTSV
ncbi:neuropeptide FF receptor 2-like isoform X2 [Stylophora pistillata]|nr:neuropeptide FF receptor 2-like isoform X2 [Stylophora pistillata]